MLQVLYTSQSHDSHVIVMCSYWLPPAPVFYEMMKSYLLTGQQLVENGYPRPMGTVGVASINWGRDPPPDIQPVGTNGITGQHVHVVYVWVTFLTFLLLT